MNEARRKLLVKVENLLAEAKSLVERVRDEEQETYDNMPKNMQSGEKGSTLESNVENLSDISDALDGAIDNMTSVQ
jgi:hypothetical protein